MNRQFSLACELYPGVILRTAREEDQSNLRHWKNENRFHFFFKDVILEPAQQEWFRNYLAREEDFMFVVETDGRAVGCMGFRLLSGTWDIYNVILGDPEYSRQGIMKRALHMTCSYAMSLRTVRISAKVLKDNPAISWYCRNGFGVISDHAEYVEVELDTSNFKACAIRVL